MNIERTAEWYDGRGRQEGGRSEGKKRLDGLWGGGYLNLSEQPPPVGVFGRKGLVVTVMGLEGCCRGIVA